MYRYYLSYFIVFALTLNSSLSQINLRSVEDSPPVNKITLLGDGSHRSKGETTEMACQEGEICKSSKSILDFIGWGTIIIEHAWDFITTGEFDCAEAAVDVACQAINFCDLVLNVLDKDSCDIVNSVDFAFSSTLDVSISNFIEKLPVCKDTCKPKGPVYTDVKMNLRLIKNNGGISDNNGVYPGQQGLPQENYQDELQFKLLFSNNQYVQCKYIFAPFESKIVDITIPCYDNVIVSVTELSPGYDVNLGEFTVECNIEGKFAVGVYANPQAEKKVLIENQTGYSRFDDNQPSRVEDTDYTLAVIVNKEADSIYKPIIDEDSCFAVTTGDEMNSYYSSADLIKISLLAILFTIFIFIN